MEAPFKPEKMASPIQSDLVSVSFLQYQLDYDKDGTQILYLAAAKGMSAIVQQMKVDPTLQDVVTTWQRKLGEHSSTVTGINIVRQHGKLCVLTTSCDGSLIRWPLESDNEQTNYILDKFSERPIWGCATSPNKTHIAILREFVFGEIVLRSQQTNH